MGSEEKKKPMTERQRQARLENLKNANGPTTADGKERSARNSTKHGGWSRKLWAIHKGPLREDPDELAEFVDEYIAELNPGPSRILQQAARDVADKAWRITRAQRWEAQGFTGADYQTQEATAAAWMRFNAGHYRGYAEAVRRLTDPDVLNEDLTGALCLLGFSVGRSEEDQEWVEDADRTAVVEALADLINEHFDDQEEAAAVLDARADSEEAEARKVEELWRPHIIRQELDGSFARNAERLVSHASREFDRALKRYEMLVDRFGDAEDRESGDDQSVGDQLDEGEDPEAGEGGVVSKGDPNPPEPDSGADGAAEPELDSRADGAGDKLDIWSFMTADEVIDYLSNLPTTSSSDPPARNEPTERSPAM